MHKTFDNIKSNLKIIQYFVGETYQLGSIFIFKGREKATEAKIMEITGLTEGEIKKA